MTDRDISGLSPQKLNEAVARKLGVKIGKQSFLDGSSYVKMPKDYCHSIEAAWEIWERIAKTEWTIAIETQGSQYNCWLSHPTERQIIVKADTAPMAICLAFLKLDERP